MTATYAAPAETSKLLKRALAKRFPATRFSVKLSRGTGYGNCSVGWTDGPSTKLVKEITRQYEGSGFDGMTDSQFHIDNPLADGRQTGLSMISESRHISPRFARRLADAVANFYGIEPPRIDDGPDGYWDIVAFDRNVAGTGEDWYTLIHRAGQDRESVLHRLELVTP